MDATQTKTTVITWNGRDATVKPAGNVVAALVPELRAAMRGALIEGAREMFIDFSGVQMVDSTGLGLLISAHNSMSKAGGKLAVIHASKEILDLFRSMRIHQHFSVSQAAPEAVTEGQSEQETAARFNPPGIDNELVQDYLAECLEHLATIETDLLAIE
jgi:anti-sigma B factor antagonist